MAGTLIQTNQDLEFTAIREAAWGTAVVVAPVGLPTDAMDFSAEPMNHRVKRSRQSRIQNEADSWNDILGMIPTASVKIPLTTALGEMFFSGIFQKSTDWAAAANTWTWTPQEIAALPDIALLSEGYFYTLVRNASLALHDERITSAVMSSMKLSLSSTDDDRLLMAEMEFFGKTFERGITSGGTTAHASLVAADLFKFSDLNVVTYNAVDIKPDILGFEINITNGAKFLGDAPESQVGFPGWEVSGSFTMLASAAAETIKGLAIAEAISTAKPLYIQFGAGDPPIINGGLAITVFAVIKGQPGIEWDEGETITFEFDGVRGAGAAEHPITIEMGET